MKLNKKGRKRGNKPVIPMSLDISDSNGTMRSTKSNSSATSNGSTGYKSKYAQPVVGSYG